MGWLRNLMEDARPPVRSYGELARRTLEDPSWSDEHRPQARSLAALFSKFDRGIELEWLADRQPAQFALSEALGCPLSQVSAALGGQLAEGDRQTRRLRFDDVPYARPLDLLADSLPPGVPPLLATPTAWARLWWFAPSGSGRSLVGAWLEARGRATYVDRRTWNEAVTDLPSAGPVYCEIHADTHVGDAIGTSQICVAAPFLPRGGTWTVLHSPPLSEALPELLRWLQRRLPPDGNFDAEQALEWLRPTTGLVQTLGDVLGVAGMLDEIGARALRGKRVAFLAQKLVDSRLKRAALDGDADAAWLRREGLSVVVGLARQALLDSELPVEAPRSQKEWFDLVPAELQQGVDTQWLRASLARTAAPKTVRDIERALDDLPPGAFRVVRALSSADLLRRDAHHGGYALAPAWVRNAALRRAVEELCHSSPSQWGEALLREHTADRVARGMAARFAKDPSTLIDEVLDHFDARRPQSVAALELVFRLAGHAVLEGDDLNEEQLRALWDEQRHLAVVCSTSIAPRVPHRADSVGWLGDGAWYLAWLAVASRMASTEVELSARVQPFVASSAASRLGVLEAIDAFLQTTEAREPSYLVSLAELLDAVLPLLRAPNDELGDTDTAIAALADLRVGDLRWARLVALSRVPVVLAAARARAGSRWNATLEQVWAAWQSAGFPEATAVLSALRALDPTLDRSLPVDVLERLLSENPAAVSCLSLADLAPATWSALLTRVADLPVAVAREVCLSVPAKVLDATLAEGALDASAPSAAALWARFPDKLLAHMSSVSLTTAVELARRAESASIRVADLVDAFRAIPSKGTASKEEIELLRGWLSARVRSRTDGWRSAFALLHDVEEQEHRVGRARGASE